MIGVEEWRHRQPDLAVFRKPEIRRHDPDNSAGLVVHRDHPSDNRWIAGVKALSDGIAEQDDAVGAGSIFVRAKETSELRGNAEERKQVGGYQLPREPHRLRALRDGDASAAVGGDAVEGA
jgi:hypothetical protein